VLLGELGQPHVAVLPVGAKALRLGLVRWALTLLAGLTARSRAFVVASSATAIVASSATAIVASSATAIVAVTPATTATATTTTLDEVRRDGLLLASGAEDLESLERRRALGLDERARGCHGDAVDREVGIAADMVTHLGLRPKE
jgi:hypothetical protein